MKAKAKSLRAAKKPSGGKSTLSAGAWRLVREEAASLGMTHDEYVRLTGHLFSTLRKTLAKEQPVDGKGLLQLVENPLFGAVMQYLATQVSTAKEASGTGGSPPSATPSAQSPSPQPENAAIPRPVQNVQQPPHIPPEWQFW